MNRNGVDPNSGEPTTEVAMFVARDAAMSKRIQELETALIKCVHLDHLTCNHLADLILRSAGVPVPGLPHAVAKRTTAGSHKRSRSSPARETDSESESSFSFSNGSEPTDVTMGFGTLTIDPHNRGKYIGLSGASAFLSADTWSCLYDKRQENEVIDLH